LGYLSKGIRSTLKTVAGIYLLLNLCVATIPRCDTILSVLQHTLKSQDWATMAHHADSSTSCHEAPVPGAHISTDKLCECSLVKFVFITLPTFDPQQFIGFNIQTTTLLSFAIALWNPAT